MKLLSLSPSITFIPFPSFSLSASQYEGPMGTHTLPKSKTSLFNSCRFLVFIFSLSFHVSCYIFERIEDGWDVSNETKPTSQSILPSKVASMIKANKRHPLKRHQSVRAYVISTNCSSAANAHTLRGIFIAFPFARDCMYRIEDRCSYMLARLA